MTLIRPAEPTDAEPVLALARAFAASFSVEEVVFRRSFAELLAAPGAHLAVAEGGREILGYVLGFLHPALYASGLVAWVEELMVDPAHRRRGVGRLLIRGFEAWAGTRGAVLVAL